MSKRNTKRNKGNRHPADSFAPKFRRIKNKPRQHIRQVLRKSIPLDEVEYVDLNDRPELDIIRRKKE